MLKNTGIINNIRLYISEFFAHVFLTFVFEKNAELIKKTR